MKLLARLMAISVALVATDALAQGIRIPSIDDMGLDVQTMAKLSSGDGQLIVLHPSAMRKVKDGDKVKVKRTQFATSGVLVDAPIDFVKKVALDFQSYPLFFDQVKKVEPLGRQDNRSRVKWELGLDFSIVTIGIDYTLEYIHTENAAYWRLVEGDMDENFGAWEFVPVGEDKTLFFYTAWADIRSQSWLIAKVMDIQPDLEDAISVSNVTVVTKAVRKRVHDLYKASQSKP